MYRDALTIPVTSDLTVRRNRACLFFSALKRCDKKQKYSRLAWFKGNIETAFSKAWLWLVSVVNKVDSWPRTHPWIEEKQNTIIVSDDWWVDVPFTYATAWELLHIVFFKKAIIQRINIHYDVHTKIHIYKSIFNDHMGTKKNDSQDQLFLCSNRNHKQFHIKLGKLDLVSSLVWSSVPTQNITPPGSPRMLPDPLRYSSTAFDCKTNTCSSLFPSSNYLGSNLELSTTVRTYVANFNLLTLHRKY